eukprot:IDg1319t1
MPTEIFSISEHGAVRSDEDCSQPIDYNSHGEEFHSESEEGGIDILGNVDDMHFSQNNFNSENELDRADEISVHPTVDDNDVAQLTFQFFLAFADSSTEMYRTIPPLQPALELLNQQSKSLVLFRCEREMSKSDTA